VATDPVGAQARVESALVARLSQVRDLRRRRGLRHRLVLILVLAACATLVVGSDSMAAIWQWAAAAPQDKLARLGARWNPFTRRFVVPSERTFRRVLAGLDGDGLDGAVGGWVADVERGVAAAPVVPDTPGPVEREQRRAVQRAVEHPVPHGVLPGAAVDGKALRGARTDTGPVFLVAAIGHASGAVLGQRQVPSKRGEGVAARDLLTCLNVPGMVWTLDALHTTRATARLITMDLHGHYVLIIKGNQPIAQATAAALLTGPDTHWVATTAGEDDRGHGRVERRTIRVAPAGYWIADWPRHQVPATALAPLLAESTHRRSVSLHVEPLGPREAEREVMRERTARSVAVRMRQRTGQIVPEHERAALEQARAQDVERAAGHGLARFTGYVTLTVTDEGAIEDACAELEADAAAARIELRRMWLTQDVGFAMSALPLGFGLPRRRW